MKYFLLLIITLGSSPVFASNDKLDEKYAKTIEKLEASCKSLKPFTVPQNVNEQFCSPSPENQISVRYCIYQNMLNPQNTQSITFVHPKLKSDKNETTQVSVTIKCSDIRI